ncbi:plant intracellular Ras-group-related LRR protein 6-like isoform X2 [Malus sylvestris]|uniref:plant intracellular Ras-group-related LRR protein 6-like isoform X2 n=1 Tax=Malus sylvestris TaxID=3752 RepID=UPI0021ACCE64|nr:plant intracellular Ras-group-related LRR protein 6-like isoform X2 [Malus sylvestris]
MYQPSGSGRGECRLVLPHLWRGCSQVSNPRPTAHGRRHLPSHQTLILSRKKITDWPGAILQSLPNLLCLKLDNNPLRQIPPGGFQAAPMLQILDLSGNVASLPEHPAFSSLPHLQELYLRQMQLREVPSEVLSLQQLRILDLSQNSLQLVPVEFKNLASLTELGLSDNNISMLSPELGLLEPSLQALRLDGNPLRRIVTGSMPNSIIWEIRLRMYGNHLCVADLRWTKMQGNSHLLAYDNLRRDPKLKYPEDGFR